MVLCGTIFSIPLDARQLQPATRLRQPHGHKREHLTPLYSEWLCQRSFFLSKIKYNMWAIQYFIVHSTLGESQYAENPQCRSGKLLCLKDEDDQMFFWCKIDSVDNRFMGTYLHHKLGYIHIHSGVVAWRAKVTKN